MSETNEVNDTVDLATRLAPLLVAMIEAKQAVELAQLAYEASLHAIHELTPTFQQDGKWYQVRYREDSKQGRPITYLCDFKQNPKTGGKRGPRKSKHTDHDGAPIMNSASETMAEASMAHVAGSIAAEAEANAEGNVVME